jgi:hypothetical protein
VAQNVLSGNQFGITISGTTGAVVQRNEVIGTRASGIAAIDGSVSTTIAQNVVTGSWTEGIRTDAGTSGSVVVQNTTSYNGSDGITVVATTVTKNTSTYNQQLGIRATGSLDGGGNKAAFNGDAAQCLGVVCGTP